MTFAMMTPEPNTPPRPGALTMSAAEAMNATAALYAAIAVAVEAAAKAGLSPADIQAVLERCAEVVGETDGE
jgi:hypothetical protein